MRLKGVVMSIVKSGMPSELITDFLVTLVEDGNYFTAGVLWDCEVDRLDFSRYEFEQRKRFLCLLRL